MLLTLFPGGSSVSHVGVIQIGRGWGRVCVSASSPGPSYLSSCIKRSTITELKQLWNLRRLCKLVSAFSITETHTGHVGSTLNNKRKPPCFSLSHTHTLFEPILFILGGHQPDMPPIQFVSTAVPPPVPSAAAAATTTTAARASTKTAIGVDSCQEYTY